MSIIRTVQRVSKRLYRQLSASKPDTEVERIQDVLTEVPVFETCAARTHRVMAEAMHPRTYQPGEVIYYEHDPGLGLYVVEKGQVRLCANWKDERFEMRMAGPNTLFGALSLMGDFRRMETAEAVTAVEVAGFFRPDLSSLSQRHPKAALDIQQALLRFMAQQYASLVDVIGERDGRKVALQCYADASAQALDRAASGDS
ncbi:MAG: cyclic nucleotide-binding domain-containing protein [Longimonas sp.]|uniref:Crp/Fnr family transcriptional regulator n=1 Tax=Longimonas sp. TaxID=2039626 RepID=UPI003976A7FD